MRKKIDEVSLLLKKHNIIVPASIRKADHREETEKHETFHALKASCSTTNAFLIDARASNHMLHLENHSLPCSILIFLVFIWEIIVKFKPKGRVLLSLNMESSKMCFMCPP